MPASIPKCINGGGWTSRIILPSVPVLDQEMRAGTESLAALTSWQARVGEILTISDPGGQEYRARVVKIDRDSAILLPFARIGDSESPMKIGLFQALPEKERFELVLQKTTEIGVNRIVPFTCQRSINLQQRDAGQKKSHRWPDVLLRAARQCRRAEIPELFPVLEWAQVLESTSGYDLSMIFYAGARTTSLAAVLERRSPTSIALIIGPEGGFSPQEIEQASSCGIVATGLGSRILRTETAAIVATAAIQLSLGDLGQ